MDHLSIGEIEGKLTRSLEKLFKNDRYLFEADVNERSISHMFAFYLKQEFTSWDVDCEYNRDNHSTKKLDGLEDKLREMNRIDLIRNLDAITVYPDIIIHKRGTDNNLLVIEIKKTTSVVSQ